ncbi:unnamed protein product [Prorocentrum cordatum]|uniref:Uncharacterized protein n=1 Tax=Prorocentrum cordatum TaxID=2364126 RepID=A0ABN9SES8_9DINO|nr:unnamed protein product [Polarella glacialis]
MTRPSLHFDEASRCRHPTKLLLVKIRVAVVKKRWRTRVPANPGLTLPRQGERETSAGRAWPPSRAGAGKGEGAALPRGGGGAAGGESTLGRGRAPPPCAEGGHEEEEEEEEEEERQGRREEGSRKPLRRPRNHVATKSNMRPEAGETQQVLNQDPRLRRSGGGGGGGKKAATLRL